MTSTPSTLSESLLCGHAPANDLARALSIASVVLLVFVVQICGIPAAIAAEIVCGIAMHGEPKYAGGFEHFDYANPKAPKGGTLRYAAVGTFDTLNPHVVKGVPAAGLGYVFETLLARAWDEPFSLYGLLAESVEMPPDRSEIVFRVDSKARWHDGTAVTAEDILFSFDVQRRFGTPNRRQYYGRVGQAQMLDERTVRFAFVPDSDGAFDRELPLIMGLMPIHQKAWWEGREFERTTLEPPMGSGPYRVAEVDAGRRIVFNRVRDYWGANLPTKRGMHNFDRIIFDYYRDDSVALEAFKAGEADIRREDDPNKWATGYDGPALASGRFVKLEEPHQRPESARGFIFNERRALFRDVRVRRALGMAADFGWINRTFFHDALKRTRSYYPNSELAATGLPSGLELEALEPLRSMLPPALFAEPFDLPSGGDRADRRAAFELLEQAGWRVEGQRLVDAAGQPFAFEILLGDPSDERVAMEFGRGLSRLGIAARIRTVDGPQFQQRLDDFDFDMTLRGWTSTLSPGNEQIYYFGSAAAGQSGSRNYPGIRDAAVDALAGALGQAKTRDELVGDVRALDRVLLWGHHMVPLFYSPVDRLAVSSRLGRPKTTPLYGAMPETWWEER